MTQVTIRYHQEPEGWWADSDQIPGWTAVGATFGEVSELARDAVRTFVEPGAAIHEEGVPWSPRAGEG
jgi:predicted RNase H-like HicB family nuclease